MKICYISRHLKLKGRIMAVMINDTCINCAACIDECPVEAIVDEDDNPTGEECYYVYPDKCVECVGHFDVPSCAEACPTEGCITWDMPFTAEHKEFFAGGNYIDGGNYSLENADIEQPFVEAISMDDRKNRTPVVED
jgi:ferredoxin